MDKKRDHIKIFLSPGEAGNISKFIGSGSIGRFEKVDLYGQQQKSDGQGINPGPFPAATGRIVLPEAQTEMIAGGQGIA